VAAGFGALRDDRVDAARLEPARLVHRRRRGDDLRAPAAHVREQLGRGQAEVKAHDRWPEFRDELRRLDVERCASRSCGNLRGVEPELAVIRRQRGAPRALARRIRRRLCVAEEVHVVRLRRVRGDSGDLVAQAVGRQHRARE
jgi:hypothetical protein